MDRYASRLGKQLKITESLAMTKPAERIRGFAESLGHLEKVTGVIGIFSGALSAIEGVSSNDVEGAVGGVLDVAEESWAWRRRAPRERPRPCGSCRCGGCSRSLPT